MLKYKTSYIPFTIFTVIIGLVTLFLGKVKEHNTLFIAFTFLIPHIIFWFFNGIFKLQSLFIKSSSLSKLYSLITKAIQYFMDLLGGFMFLFSFVLTLKTADFSNLSYSSIGIATLFAGITTRKISIQN